jgi:hypothetical protein
VVPTHILQVVAPLVHEAARQLFAGGPAARGATMIGGEQGRGLRPDELSRLGEMTEGTILGTVVRGHLRVANTIHTRARHVVTGRRPHGREIYPQPEAVEYALLPARVAMTNLVPVLKGTRYVDLT